jgi:choline dehydrogenase-like flavoprotein
MHIDLDEVSDRVQFESVVCIVGGGIAGLLLARSLASRGIDVHLLEAGGHALEPRSQEMYNVQMEGRHHDGATNGRFRVFGGSSTRWGGQLLPYTSDIFTPPPGAPSAAWPLGTRDVEPYYSELRKIMHVSDQSPDGRFLKSIEVEKPIEDPNINVRFSKWTPFSKRNLAKTVGIECLNSGRITVFLHANVTSIEVNGGSGVAERIVSQSYNGKTYKFLAKHFVICAGTIESCRLLLASRSAFDCGLGNTNDQVGRYFHDHLSVSAAVVPQPTRAKFVKLFSPLFVGGTLHTPKLEASPSLRKKERLLAVMAHFTIEEPEESGIAVLRNVLQGIQHGDGVKNLPKAMLVFPASCTDIARVLWFARVRKRRAISSRAKITLRLDSEQLPSAQSRIKLSAEHDRLGMPRAIVDWRISDEEHRTIQVYANVVANFLTSVGLGPLDWYPELSAHDDSWLNLARDTYHHMGGTRMGTDPRSSVVNPDLQVHGISNLFVTSCSVFPGGGSSNPTFTLMALALRLADRLAKLCASSAVSQRSENVNWPASEPQLVAHG